MTTHDQIAYLFDAYRSVYPEEGENFPILSAQIQDFDADISSRKNFTGHVVADGCVIDPRTKKILLIHHKTLQFWGTPGGHIEQEDNHPAEAAAREVFEETGVKVTPVLDEQKEPLLLHIDSHIIPAHEGKSEPEHWHHAMTFLFLADSTLPLLENSDEGVVTCRWADFSEERGNEYVTRFLHKIELF